MTKELDKLREKIDELDNHLVHLLNERVKVALEIGAAKKQKQGEIYVPAREKAVFYRVNGLNEGPLLQQSLEAIYREVMSASLALEHDTTITYLGPPATYTHQAAHSKFGSSVTYHPCANISDVFESVVSGSSDYGVVPIENSTEGAVTHTLDEFMDTDAMICAEVYLPIEHHLLSKSELADIKTVYSNSNALGQCRSWLQQNVPHANVVPVTSTARAAELAVEESEAAAVCSVMASELYDLPIRAAAIQDIRGNSTRFLVIARNYGVATGGDKTSLMFSVEHKAGALHNALAVLDDEGLNMTKIESRPSKLKNWEYFFFVDVEGHASDENIKKALGELEPHCTILKVLGSFPRVRPAGR